MPTFERRGQLPRQSARARNTSSASILWTRRRRTPGFPERVAEQAKYFGVTTAQALQLGVLAQKFTEAKTARAHSPSGRGCRTRSAEARSSDTTPSSRRKRAISASCWWRMVSHACTEAIAPSGLELASDRQRRKLRAARRRREAAEGRRVGSIGRADDGAVAEGSDEEWRQLVRCVLSSGAGRGAGERDGREAEDADRCADSDAARSAADHAAGTDRCPSVPLASKRHCDRRAVSEARSKHSDGRAIDDDQRNRAGPRRSHHRGAPLQERERAAQGERNRTKEIRSDPTVSSSIRRLNACASLDALTRTSRRSSAARICAKRLLPVLSRPVCSGVSSDRCARVNSGASSLMNELG